MMLGPGRWAKTLRDAAAKEFDEQAVVGAEGQGDSKDAYRARLKQLESLRGNSITLSALLTHNWYFWHMRMIMQCPHLLQKSKASKQRRRKHPTSNLAPQSD